MISRNNADLLKELRSIVDILNNSLPTEAPFSLSYVIDPIRALVLREACLYRVAELTESVYEAFVQDRLIVAFILSRAFMETETLFWTFIEKLETSIKTCDIGAIQAFLTNCLAGVKDDQFKKFKRSKDSTPITTPINILTLIKKMGKLIKFYDLHYASLSEFSHPNAAGTIDSYVSLDHDNSVVRFGKNRTKLTPELALPQLVGSLRCFLEKYDRSARLMEQFTTLCEDLLKSTT